MTTWSRPHIWTLALAWLAGGGLGCGLGGIPTSFGPEPAADMGAPDQPGEVVCEPGRRTCDGPNVQVCSEDGRTFYTEVCPLRQTCREGACAGDTETCEDGVEVAISRTELFFEPAPDLKTTSEQIEVTNCTERALRLRKLDVASAQSRGGFGVFTLSREAAALRGAQLSPGDSVPIKLELRPRQAGWVEQGTLYLSFEGGESLRTREVPLRSSTWCLSKPKLLDVGVVESGAEIVEPITLHNCGTRAMLVSGAALRGISREALDWSLQGVDWPLALRPGDTATLELRARGVRPGPVRGELELSLNPRDEAALALELKPTPLHGRVVPQVGPCAPPELEPLWLQPLLGDRPGPMTIHLARLPLEELGPGWTARLEASRAGSFGDDALLVPLEPAGVGSALFIPYLVDDYELTAQAYSPSGQPSCQMRQLELELGPPAPIYVELDWEGLEDPVPGDEGPSRGMDLDLYARLTPRDQEPGSWRDPATTCAAALATRRACPEGADCPGEVICPGGQSRPGCATRDVRACAADRGLLLATSETGSNPEALALDLGDDEPHHLDIGVHLRHTGIYETACARVRIWYEGRLVAELPGEDDEATGCARGFGLQSTGKFWWVGRLDTATRSFRTEGFDGQFPRIPDP